MSERLQITIKHFGDHGEDIVKRDGRLTSAQLMDVAKAGAEIVKDSAATMVRTKRKQDVGAGIAESVDYSLGAGASGAVAKIGWKGRGLKKTSRYRDVNGKARKVYTTADVGGILEYSAKRQLRHMEPGYEESKEAATDAMEKAADAMVQQMLS